MQFNSTGYIWSKAFHCTPDLEFGALWFLILIPFAILVGMTYGVPYFIVPWYNGSKHKVLTLLGNGLLPTFFSTETGSATQNHLARDNSLPSI